MPVISGVWTLIELSSRRFMSSALFEIVTGSPIECIPALSLDAPPIKRIFPRTA